MAIRAFIYNGVAGEKHGNKDSYTKINQSAIAYNFLKYLSSFVWVQTLIA